jgi:serine/threonine protein kinase
MQRMFEPAMGDRTPSTAHIPFSADGALAAAVARAKPLGPSGAWRSTTPGAGRSAATPCPSEDQILAFVEGRLLPVDIASVDAHLSECGPCSELVLQALHVSSGFVASSHADKRCWALNAGTKLADRYEVRRPIGQGGMGDIYEGYDTVSGECVAIKTVKVSHSDKPELLLRLAAEGRLARRVRHPNVCRVHDVPRLRGADAVAAVPRFLCMDLITGESLSRRLAGGPLELTAALRLARDLLAGLAAIHQANVIHRDIKSHNVMIGSLAGSPRARIIDFGLALDVSEGWLGRLPPCPPGAGLLEGSPAYMAPEQLRAEDVTPATDVFACGVVLFEAVTGVLPFGVARAACQRFAWPGQAPLRAHTVNSRVPMWLDSFISCCLEPQPSARFANAGVALRAFEAEAAEAAELRAVDGEAC